MIFQKIALKSRNLVELVWTSNAPGDEKTKVLHSIEEGPPPAPEFVAALFALAPLVLEVLEIPEPSEKDQQTPRWGETLTVTGVSFSTDRNGRAGTVITAVKKLTKGDGSVVMNTPLLRSLLPDEKDAEDLPSTWLMLKPEEEEILATLRERASEYVAGKRAQGDLFDQPKTGPALVTAGQSDGKTDGVMPTAKESRKR